MNILIVTIGSRGDVEPFIALGQALLARGHAVHLCAALRFKSLIERYGLIHHPLSDDLFKLADGGVMEKLGNPMSAVKTIYQLTKSAKSINHQMMADSIAAGFAAQPDLVIFHPKSLAAVSLADKLGVPAIMALLQPMIVPTKAFPPAGLPDLGGCLNRVSYRLIDMGYRQYIHELNKLRATLLHLEPLEKNSGVFHRSDRQEVPRLHAFSQHLVSRPTDWPENAVLTGNWSLSIDQDDYKPPKALIQFLESGQAPIYIGFGSMAGRDPKQLTQTIIHSVSKAKLRAVIATGWGGLEAVPENMLIIDSAPHNWLFPRVAAVVHHGGAGTTMAGLKAGKPSLICPFFADQPFWGKTIYNNNLGPKPIKQKHLNVDTLTPALVDLTTNKSYQRYAAKLEKQLNIEDGLVNAIHWLETHGYLSR
ncbi:MULTISPECIES: glycosyltransferase [Vibrio]|nr:MULTISPECIES: glycosyltransferase [Vibrio]EEX34396.1 UDP-glucose:sterol glucosyltransferase [Vibrio coralliilyticus ATCC BAA-450]MDE3898440.1 glycosyltransferase family 1 protein [Vibrio sp. CC007]